MRKWEWERRREAEKARARWQVRQRGREASEVGERKRDAWPLRDQEGSNINGRQGGGKGGIERAGGEG
jgi:hypothetical protein